MIQVRCYGRYHEDSRVAECARPKEECPLYNDITRITEHPCCDAIFIPNRFLTAAKDKAGEVDKSKAAKYYLEDCILQE